MNTSWQEINNKLVKEFEFSDFPEAIQFINQIAQIAERQNHHPEIKNIYNKVTLTLSTHDAGDIITDQDRQLANIVDNLHFNE